MSDRRANTRQSMLDVAAALFVRQGYATTSLREIGREAGVDAALVIHYFGSKEKLFLEAMPVGAPDPDLFAGPEGDLGERVIRYILASDDHVKASYLALIRGGESDPIARRFRERHEADFVAPLVARLHGPSAELRARLAAALVGGLLYALWVVGDEGLLAAEPDEVARRYGALLQALVDGP